MARASELPAGSKASPAAAPFTKLEVPSLKNLVTLVDVLK